MLLYDYQQWTLDEIRKAFAAGYRKLLLWLATGGGKTHIFCEILKRMYKNNKRAILVVRGRKLVSQASKRLARENVPHGVIMAGNDFGHHHRILIASIDTLTSRNIYPESNLVVIDEGHQATSQLYLDLLSHYPNTKILSVTATPFGKKSLRHICDKIIAPISIRELIERGFLVPPKVFAPSIPNLSGVKFNYGKGDYNEKDLAIVMSEKKIVGDLVTHWESLGENRPTVCFAVNISHSKMIVDSFNRVGIPAVHLDANHSDDYRDHEIKRLVSGDIKIISNVGIFGIGVDIPPLSCLILARPTESENLYIQQVGRGIRSFDGKENCIVLDHAGNTLRHGFITAIRIPNIDGEYIKSEAPKIIRCKECLAVIESYPCEYCGIVPEKLSNGGEAPEHVEGSLVEVGSDEYELNIKSEIERLNQIQKINGFKSGFTFAKIAEKYGMGAAQFYCS